MSRLTINSNIPSLNAQRSLANATKKLGDSYTRLSSGLRINKASDDAAGLSISESLKADTRLFYQGVRNLNDGVSLLNIADGALNELTNIVTRLSELATQSANGTFSNKQRLALDQEAQSLSKEYNRIARTTSFNGRNLFDGDFGLLSLAAGGGSESLISSGLGGSIGDGTFQARISYETVIASQSILLDDFNGDGIKDLVTAGTNSIGLMIGNGDGSFKTNNTFTALNSGTIEAGDINGDGFLDIVSSLSGSNRSFSFFLGNGNGSFKAEVSIRGPNDGGVDIELADFNNDGKLDILESGTTGNATATLYLGNGNATFQRGNGIGSAGGSNGRKVTVGDFNNDGILDIINTQQNFIDTYMGRGDGTFTRISSFAVASNSNFSDTILSDINDDGIQDLVFASSASIAIALGNNNGTFRVVNNFSNSGNTFGLNIGDFNGDGKKDIVASANGGPLNILIGNGDGSFLQRVSYATTTSPTNAILEDFNKDGVLDLLHGDNFGFISVLFANSNNGIGSLQSFSLKTKADSLDAMDYFEFSLSNLSKQRGQIGAFQSRLDVATSTLQTSSLNYQEANSRITDIDVAEESSRLAATQILQQSAASILAQANQQPRLVLSLLGDL